MTLRLTPRPRGRAPKGTSWDPVRGQWVSPPARPTRAKRASALRRTVETRSASTKRASALKRTASPSPMETRASKKRKTARTPKTLARQALTNEQFRNQIAKILDTQKLSRAQLLTLKNNVNQRTGMNTISNRISLLLNPRSAPRPSARGTNLSSKEEILMYIYTRIRANKNSRDAYAWAVLYTIMNKIFATRLVDKFNTRDVDRLFEDVKSHLSRSRTGNSRIHSKNLTDEELVDMLFLMYLDGVHDKYLKDVNFQQFLTTGYVTEIIDSGVLKFVKNYASRNKITPLFQTFYGLANVEQGVKRNINELYNGTRAYSSDLWKSPNRKPTKEIIGPGWEANFKKNIETLFPRQVKDVISVDSINKLLVSGARGDKRIYTGIDQEAESQPISTIIETSMTNRGYFLYPYISLGVLLDPGNTMVRRMLKNDIAHILSDKPSVGLMYDVEPTTISFSWRNTNFFVINSGMIELPAISRNSRDLLGKPVLTVRANGSLVPIGASSGEAKANEVAKSKRGKFTKGFIEFGKFMGDGLQYMYLASKRQQANPRAFCSGDGMACASYMFYSKLFGKTEPPLIVDGGVTQGTKLTIYNIGDYVNLRSTMPRPVQVASNLTNTLAGRNSPDGNEAQSRLRRIETKTPGASNLSPGTLQYLLARATAPR